MGQRMLKVAVVGAETLPGQDLLESLFDEDFPMETPSLFTVGDEEATASLEDEDVRILPLTRGALTDQDLVFVLPGARPEPGLLEEATRSGGIVLDASGQSKGAPLIFPGLNEEELEEHPDERILALPSPLAAQLAAVLLPLDAKATVRSVEVVALEPAAAKGLEGLDELSQQTIDLLSGREPGRKTFPYRLAFNLVPLVGRLETEGETDDERVTLEELGRLFGREVEGSLVSAWVPLFHGTTLFLTVRTERPLDREAARTALSEAEGVEILDDPEHQVVPMPMLAVGDSRVHVGRIRRQGESLHLISVADGLRFGVASPLVGLAKELLKLGRFSA